MALKIGDILGNRYRIDALLGEGGLGAVFKARDLTLERDVVIKLLHTRVARDPQWFHQQILHAFSAVARLNHPGIARFFELGQEEACDYTVMEFISGGSLRQLINRLRAEGRSMGIDEAVRLARQVCLAVGHIHKQGLLHLDIKPENIMLKPEPSDGLPYRPVITDLGRVKVALVTLEGAVYGAASYLSPERARGVEEDARSDVYSLGVLLFELVTGQQPFPAGPLIEMIRRHVQESPRRPRSLRPDVPAALEALILQALAKDPDERPRDAAALAAALDDVLVEMAAPEEGEEAET